MSAFPSLTIRARLCRGAAVALMASAAVVPAAVSAALPPASLLEASWSNDPQWSPDGSRLAFVRTTVDAVKDDYATDVWLVDRDGKPRALTTDAAADTNPRWSPDGRWLAFASSRSGKRQIHLLDMAGGGEAVQLTAVADGAGGFAWSPDSQRIAFTSRTPLPEEAKLLPPDPAPDDKRARPPYVTERMRVRNDGTLGWAPLKRNHLWVVEVAGAPKAAAKRVSNGPYDDGDPVWSGDGRTLFFSAARKDDEREQSDSELYAVPADGSAEPRALTSRDGPDGAPVVSPDGRWLAWTGFDEKTPPASHRVTRLYAMRADGAALGTERRELAVGIDRSIGEPVNNDSGAPRTGGLRLQWQADSKAVRFAAADRGNSHLFVATLDGKWRPLTTYTSGDVREFNVSTRGELAAVFSAPALPAELYRAPLKAVGAAAPAKAWTAVTSASYGDVSRFVDHEEVTYPSFDGQPIQGWVLKPPGFDATKRWPLVLYIHGGPHTAYGNAFFHEFQVLANAGYVVLITNPRGSTSYGEQFANVIQYKYPGDDFTDLMKGVDFMVARGYIDTKRMVVGGGSGGGLLTSWTVTQDHRFAAALVERAVTNWHSFTGTADLNHFFATHWFRAMPWEDTADYLARSPLQQVGKVTTPTLVLHSTDDYRTPLDQGLQFYAGLKMQGKPAQLAVFPDSWHGMSRDGRPSHRVKRMEIIVEWFSRYAKPGPQEPTQ